ncbi:response regulator [Butyrivibrio sp. INlla14]|uniref:response regulator n=1 Tax=Butyrivibrio sp. INlla14 TaxID=1520808 RepID=UPI0008769972|nr:response regulator [Butyrivibrio sp. INlla14]SCX97854.1 two-component system, chemotaxis family, response regulator CheY [Butyrivibrio sp. INlla14]
MKRKILLADDTTFMREMLKSALDPEKYQIIGEATDGAMAVEYYKEKKPDLMILDINMPKMNGIDALTEVIKYDSKANVIMCSDQKYENMIVMAIKRGAKDFIIKPFTSSDVITAVNKVFDNADE